MPLLLISIWLQWTRKNHTSLLWQLPSLGEFPATWVTATRLLSKLKHLWETFGNGQRWPNRAGGQMRGRGTAEEGVGRRKRDEGQRGSIWSPSLAQAAPGEAQLPVEAKTSQHQGNCFGSPGGWAPGPGERISNKFLQITQFLQACRNLVETSQWMYTYIQLGH